MDHIIHHECAHVDSLLFRSRFQHSAEHIIADLADESDFSACLVQHRKNIAWGSARIYLEKLISLFRKSALGKINKELAQCRNIILFLNAHPALPPFTEIL